MKKNKKVTPLASFYLLINISNISMKHLILIRHGQSEWNQQKRFTGWVDVGLTDKGRAEAKKAGELIKEKKIKLDSFYSSYQKRANDTLKIVMKELNEALSVGPILMGLSEPIHVLQLGASVEEIVNMSAIAVIDAQSKKV